MTHTITDHVLAGYPVIAVETNDDLRIIDEVKSVNAMENADNSETHVYAMSTQFMSDANGQRQPDKSNHGAAFEFVAAENGEQRRVLIVRDSQQFLANAMIFRLLLDAVPAIKAAGNCIVLVGPDFAWLPAELAEVPVLNQSLPTRDELHAVLTSIVEDLTSDDAGFSIDDATTEQLLNAATGLTLAQAENAFALSFAKTGALDAMVVMREKMRCINSTGFLTLEQSRPVSSVGGLGQLKQYIAEEILPHVANPLTMIRGILLCGLGGTGKSHAARCMGAFTKRPVIRLDVGACKGGRVGDTEKNIRRATELAEACAPCVLWVDEIDNALGGHQSSSKTDGGTTLGMVGHLLTWMQDHKSQILMVATCNSVAELPEPLTRSGRIDAKFVVDLPTITEREAIAKIHLAKLNCPESLASAIAGKTADWTGAEIEDLCKTMARVSNFDPTAETLAQCLPKITVNAVVNKASTDAFRKWSRSALRIANDADSTTATATEKPARKIRRSTSKTVAAVATAS